MRIPFFTCWTRVPFQDEWWVKFYGPNDCIVGWHKDYYNGNIRALNLRLFSFMMAEYDMDY